MNLNESNCCPFCEQANKCAVESVSCWCISAKIPAALIALVPENAKNRACICAACVERFRLNENSFIEAHRNRYK